MWGHIVSGLRDGSMLGTYRLNYNSGQPITSPIDGPELKKVLSQIIIQIRKQLQLAYSISYMCVTSNSLSYPKTFHTRPFNMTELVRDVGYDPLLNISPSYFSSVLSMNNVMKIPDPRSATCILPPVLKTPTEPQDKFHIVVYWHWIKYISSLSTSLNHDPSLLDPKTNLNDLPPQFQLFRMTPVFSYNQSLQDALANGIQLPGLGFDNPVGSGMYVPFNCTPTPDWTLAVHDFSIAAGTIYGASFRYWSSMLDYLQRRILSQKRGAAKDAKGPAQKAAPLQVQMYPDYMVGLSAAPTSFPTVADTSLHLHPTMATFLHVFITQLVPIFIPPSSLMAEWVFEQEVDKLVGFLNDILLIRLDQWRNTKVPTYIMIISSRV